ncbi:MAG TPA: bifunctional phosphoribosylaminoimidazolecarboxamide formyltransferase/IMP cyclohydrolase [Pseudobdellovibrionaceae bacterium]|nr:bifunctional phosphoribosylaminoimidazolecarboxamide formyltransferase/IMP cyclohydrolase [Pseudobdellovibrionaceae bacterium]
MWKRALVSVSDKTGLTELLSPLAAEGLEIISTGGTAKFLKDKGFTVKEISEVTGFPEVMDGRVKTLHPKVHMGLLGRRDSKEHMDSMKQFGVEGFDLVVVNLYPFEEAARSKASMPDLIEKIDIGGPSMLRSAAKNHASVAVLCDPTDYAWFLENKDDWNELKGRRLAAKVYAHTSVYDSLIARELGYDGPALFPSGGKLVQSLRYGENPHQTAAWYRWPADDKGLASARIIQGKELSYNNLLDLDASVSLVREFGEPGAVAVKHNNPCGAALSKNLTRAVQGALKSDPISVFGGIVAVNREVGAAEASLLSEIFLECVVAPAFSDEALAIFAKKKNLRILAWPDMISFERKFDLKSVAGGFLVQTPDRFSKDVSHWKFSGETPDDSRRSDLLFGEKVCGVLKSNSIALVADGVTVGLGMGQVNRVDAVEQALTRMKAHHPNLDPSRISLISDAFFPFPDSIEKAAEAGLRWVLQPGGSVKDEEVLAAAKKRGVNVVLTGQRHFRH